MADDEAPVPAPPMNSPVSASGNELVPNTAAGVCQQFTRFMALPSELRNKIYELLLTHDEVIFLKLILRHRPTAPAYPAATTPSVPRMQDPAQFRLNSRALRKYVPPVPSLFPFRKPASILQVSKKVYKEAGGLLYSENAFGFMTLSALQRFSQDSKGMLEHVREVHFPLESLCGSPSDWIAPISLLVGLSKLVIHCDNVRFATRGLRCSILGTKPDNSIYNYTYDYAVAKTSLREFIRSFVGFGHGAEDRKEMFEKVEMRWTAGYRSRCEAVQNCGHLGCDRTWVVLLKEIEDTLDNDADWV